MVDLRTRIDLAVRWLERTQKSDGQGGAGWGWVDDVPPNPQNTAEVVCAVHAVCSLGPRAGEMASPTGGVLPHTEEQPPTVRDVLPRADEVITLLRRRSVRHGTQPWEFDEPIDTAWRLRALLVLGVPHDDPDVERAARQLRATQNSESGGWGFSGATDPDTESITVTAAVLHALAAVTPTDEASAACVRSGVGFLVRAYREDAFEGPAMASTALIVSVLSLPECAALGGRRARRVVASGVRTLLGLLRGGGDRVEEETFARGPLLHSWRHLGLHLAVAAVATAEPKAVLDPVLRESLIELLDLQETAQAHVRTGGFRTSRHGPFASYATTIALEAMVATQRALLTHINPGEALDLFCRTDGRHHTDGRRIVGLGRHGVVLNSYAGSLFALLTGAAGATIMLMSIAFTTAQNKAGMRALLIWGMAVLAIGAYIALITRLPAVPSARIYAGVFTTLTAIAIPVITFMLSS